MDSLLLKIKEILEKYNRFDPDNELPMREHTFELNSLRLKTLNLINTEIKNFEENAPDG